MIFRFRKRKRKKGPSERFLWFPKLLRRNGHLTLVWWQTVTRERKPYPGYHFY